MNYLSYDTEVFEKVAQFLLFIIVYCGKNFNIYNIHGNYTSLVKNVHFDPKDVLNKSMIHCL